MASNPNPNPGARIPAAGGSEIDPTKNVLDLVAAMSLRQDDLRVEIVRRIDAEIKHVKDMAELRAAHGQQLDAKEAERLDKTRQVDITAVATADTRSQLAIQALAATTALNAETLRNAVAASAQALAKQFTDTVGALTERISALEKSSYEGKGRQAYADPAIAELAAQVAKLTSGGAQLTGKQEGISSSWALVLGLGSLLGVMIGLAGFIYAVTK